jgi:uncharacterized protein YndB with AHSA1/START domain
MTGAPGDAAIVSVFVAVSPEDAFAVFTQEIDLWWRQGPKFRIAGQRRGSLSLEPKLHGRLFETFEHPRGTQTFTIGTILKWEPPSALSFEWRGVNYKPNEKTWVDVSFAALGDGTMVKVRHHGFAALRPDHPVRHKLQGADFSRMIGLWWGDLMSALREHVAAKKPREE